MRVLVTGAAGFIGSRVVRRLLARGHEVRALVLASDKRDNLEGLAVEVIVGDVTRPSIEEAICGVEVVFHLAALYALWLPDPDAMMRVNVDGTRNVLAAARRRGVRRVVHTSSIARFGGQGLRSRATESSAFALGGTGNVYARSKALAHELACEAARAGQDVVIVAPTGPIGPGDIGPTPTGRLLLTAFKTPIMVTIPSITNFAHVDDIAEGHVLAAERGASGRSYLLGHRDLSVAQLAGIVAKRLGRRERTVALPFAVAELAGHAALLATRHVTRRAPLLTPDSVRIAKLGLAADCRRAVEELGMPQTSIEQAVGDAHDWFQRAGYLA